MEKKTNNCSTKMKLDDAALEGLVGGSSVSQWSASTLLTTPISSGLNLNIIRGSLVALPDHL